MNMKKLLVKLGLFLITILLVGCNVLVYEYSYQQGKEEHRLRYKINGNNLTIMVSHVDSKVDHYDGIFNYSDCRVLDEKNWECGEFGVDFLTMKDGNLSWKFGDELRKYKKTYVLNP